MRVNISGFVQNHLNLFFCLNLKLFFSTHDLDSSKEWMNPHPPFTTSGSMLLSSIRSSPHPIPAHFSLCCSCASSFHDNATASLFRPDQPGEMWKRRTNKESFGCSWASSFYDDTTNQKRWRWSREPIRETHSVLHVYFKLFSPKTWYRMSEFKNKRYSISINNKVIIIFLIFILLSRTCGYKVI